MEVNLTTYMFLYISFPPLFSVIFFISVFSISSYPSSYRLPSSLNLFKLEKLHQKLLVSGIVRAFVV